jgi:hypothetical protein
VLGISEAQFISRFCSPTHTDWRITITARKVPRAAEEPAPAKPKRAA